MIVRILDALAAHNIQITTGVPDGWLVPLIKGLSDDERFDYIAAAREEECFGIAAGAAMSGKRALVLMQNSGFLNAVGAFTTLCQKYQTPFVCLIANRGGISDSNSYDPNKYRSFEAITRSMNLFTHPSSWEDLPEAIPRAMARCEGAGEPGFITLSERLK
ncbi:MAG: thiamine pyrophosphate-binding protein [Alphaproteobacteria bacterium]